jgi:hypothetical protein
VSKTNVGDQILPLRYAAAMTLPRQPANANNTAHAGKLSTVTILTALPVNCQDFDAGDIYL